MQSRYVHSIQLKRTIRTRNAQSTHQWLSAIISFWISIYLNSSWNSATDWYKYSQITQLLWYMRATASRVLSNISPNFFFYRFSSNLPTPKKLTSYWNVESDTHYKVHSACYVWWRSSQQQQKISYSERWAGIYILTLCFRRCQVVCSELSTTGNMSIPCITRTLSWMS